VRSARLYTVVAALARVGLARLTDVHIEGVDRLPARGGVLLLPNHQSALDPWVVQAWTPRRVRSMTKSTQFASQFMQWAVPRLGGFPARRYRVDPQSVRTTLRLLTEGDVVCIYPEGERSWDARLQPFRRGALRVALATMDRGIPVIPVGISGMYDVMPRWGRMRRTRGEVRVTFGAPITLGPFESRAARDAAVPDMEAALRSQLAALSGEAAAAEATWPFGEDLVPSIPRR
jgi:1-acyl-sn-glycerol-3-phosphate acyltransferase